MQVNMDKTNCINCTNKDVCKYVDDFKAIQSRVNSALDGLEQSIIHVGMHCKHYRPKTNIYR